ncbi:MAG: tRNA lysidine(34) synthetase TilS [Acidobacteriota bacterium]
MAATQELGEFPFASRGEWKLDKSSLFSLDKSSLSSVDKSSLSSLVRTSSSLVSSSKSVCARVEQLLSEALDDLPASEPTPLVVGFSGGTDSSALLLALSQSSLVRPIAAHLDHGLDPSSRDRAKAADQIARSLGVDWVSERRTVVDSGDGIEAAGRSARYSFLAETARRVGASVVTTGHHLEDQAETVLLRILFGSGVAGLSGMAAVGTVPGAADLTLVRPLLGVRRAVLAEIVREAELKPVEDPSNLDLSLARNLVRHRLLPVLEQEEGDLAPRLARLARRARGARRRIDEVLAERLAVAAAEEGPSVELVELRSLPDPLWEFGLARLHRAAGLPLPPSARARAELRRQVAASGEVVCDCGGGWRWRESGGRLILERPGPTAPGFTYTLQAPGEVEIGELGLRFRLRRGAFEDWMLQGSARRAGLVLPLRPGQSVTVRSRRPGDRLRPFGAAGQRKLKDVLIDKRVPRAERNAIPLLCLGEEGRRIAWVPGITIDDRYRIDPSNLRPSTIWIAELLNTPPDS